MVRRWPIALCLIALMVLVPFAQAKKKGGGAPPPEQTPPPPPPPPVNTNNQQLTTDREDLNKATKAYNDLVLKLTTDFQQGSDYSAAKKELDDATTAYTAAKAAAIEKLGDNPQYKSAVDAKTAAEAKLKQLQDNGGSPSDISTAATNAMSARQSVTAFEHDALLGDADVQAKLNAQQAAQQKVAKLLSDFKTSLASNQDVTTAKKAMDDAQAKLASDQKATAHS